MARKTLSEEIKEFQTGKKRLIPALIMVGVLGLFLPVLPGVAVLFLAFLLLFPKEGEAVIKRIREKIKV